MMSMLPLTAGDVARVFPTKIITKYGRAEILGTADDNTWLGIRSHSDDLDDSTFIPRDSLVLILGARNLGDKSVVTVLFNGVICDIDFRYLWTVS